AGASDATARGIETRDPRLDRAIAEARAAFAAAAGAATEPGGAQSAFIKVRILENLLRGTPRYQQARHDVEPGVLGIPLEDWSPALAGTVRARSVRALPVTFVPRADA